MATNTLGVIFDMDGVLVDSYRAHYDAWRATARQYGLDMTEEDFARTFGRVSRDIIERLWPGRFNDQQKTQFDNQKEAAYREGLRTHFPEMKGAGELIASLHAAGFKLAIGSSGPAENVAVVKETIRNGNLISATVNGSEVHRGKPDPEVFQLAASKLGMPPARCAVVEDAFVGLQAARRAGMIAVALTGTAKREALSPEADIVIDNLSELSPAVFRDLLEGR
jgi:beta-phosphoglucomutase